MAEAMLLFSASPVASSICFWRSKPRADGGPGGLEGPGKFVGRGDAELGAREVEFVRGAADLFVG